MVGIPLSETWCRLSPDDMTFDRWVAPGGAPGVPDGERAARIAWADPDWDIDDDALLTEWRGMRRGVPLPKTAGAIYDEAATAFTPLRLDPVAKR